MSKHTPDKVIFQAHTHDEADTCEVVAEFFDVEGIGWFDSKEIATRVLACLNACAGINPKAVPDVVEALKAANEWFELIIDEIGDDKNQDFVSYQPTTIHYLITDALAKLEG